MLKTLFVGIDVSSEENVAQFMNHEGETLRPSFSFFNNQAGLDRFVQALADLG